ncbi:hypothetical protein BKA62DRAFT_497626 [Auriculariales sp. MPI-PUGE-AT-0066]|nr:hypothetical protein BKA62DRAFT_497626 [Auriculariales sp. MPI-PUGE-AT-0066]
MCVCVCADIVRVTRQQRDQPPRRSSRPPRPNSFPQSYQLLALAQPHLLRAGLAPRPVMPPRLAPRMQTAQTTSLAIRRATQAPTSLPGLATKAATSTACCRRRRCQGLSNCRRGCARCACKRLPHLTKAAHARCNAMCRMARATEPATGPADSGPGTTHRSATALGIATAAHRGDGCRLPGRASRPQCLPLGRGAVSPQFIDSPLIIVYYLLL